MESQSCNSLDMGCAVCLEQAARKKMDISSKMGLNSMSCIGECIKVAFCIETPKNKKATPFLESLFDYCILIVLPSLSLNWYSR